MPARAQNRMTVGVLALQGDFREHCAVLRRIGVEPVEVRLPRQLALVERLIIPGGESTTIGRLLVMYQMLEPIRERAGRDLAIWGTCAGAILLANEVVGQKQGGQPAIGAMNLTIQRNAYGSQLDSFEAPITMPIIGEAPLPGVFIRAPRIVTLGQGCEAVGWLEDGSVVAARQGRLLATTFHPELTGDDRVHRLFLEL